MEITVAIIVLGLVVVAQAIVHYKERRHVIDQRDSMESEVRQLLAAKNLPEYKATQATRPIAEAYYMTDEEEYALEREKRGLN